MDCEFIGWCALSASEQAAWIQAVGSILAISAAVWVPSRIASKEHDRLESVRRYKARSLAFVLKPLVAEMISGAGTAAYRWNRGYTEFDDDAMTEGLVVPKELNDRLLDMHVLGEAGKSIQEAIVAIQQLRIAIFSDYSYLRYGGVYVDHDTGDQFEMNEPDDVSKVISETQKTLGIASAELNSILGQ
ncbi:hypothetical protein [Stenotrophomonas muris]|uniref:hypothetical protein n=1 Tax=Stenotrophomonas muris TaxID=2963283 RepID=UPI00383AB233